jgi:putative chitinase
MRARQFITDDISRRGFLGGLLGAAGMGTLGYSAYHQNARQNAPGASTSDGNRPDMVATQPSKADAPTDSQKVVQKYSPDQLKDYIIDYARKYLPLNQVVSFIAQVSHETHDFRSLEENLNYSAPVLSRKYPKLFPPKLAEKVVTSPSRDRIIANTIYANRMGNGDYDSGDGYKYRGRGYIQLTGRENYEKMGKLLNVDLVNNPDLAIRPDLAAQIAVNFWKTRVSNKVNTNNIAQVTKKISGSSKQGIKSRTEKLKKYTKELGGQVMPGKSK